VHSFTSSSDRTCREGPWLRTWLLTIAVAVALLLGWEATLRRMGYRANVIDDEALWASQRARVYSQGGQKAIVLLGDCRVQLGLVPEVLRDRFAGHRVVQLSIQETSPIATLRDLAADEKFDGIVVCGLDARSLCKDMWEMQQPYVDYYHQRFGVNAGLNRFFTTLVQRTFAAANPQLQWDDLAIRLARRQPLPAPYYIETHADRSRLADYRRVDLEAHRKWAYDRIRWLSSNRELPGEQEWLQDALKVEPWVKAIQDRGGRVVFVQLPTTGPHLRFSEMVFPKAAYWDAFAARTSALCIHFQDVPQLAGFACPDTSHLDRTDAPRFTRELADVLQARGLFPAPHAFVASAPSDRMAQECRCRSGEKCALHPAGQTRQPGSSRGRAESTPRAPGSQG